jgi:hypothetical protein
MLCGGKHGENVLPGALDIIAPCFAEDTFAVFP